MKTMTFTADADGIALISIDVPGRPMNVLTPEFNLDLAEVLKTLAGDASIRGAILTSGKPGAFIAGADIKGMVKSFDAGISAADGAAMSQDLSRLLRQLETCGKPIACAINGLALGGGFEVALACHFRVLAEGASVGLPEVGIGLLPGGGGTQRLPRLIGIEKAGPILLGGQPVKAADALKVGLVHAVVPAAETVAAARSWLLGAPEAVQPWDKKGYRIPGGAGPAAPHAAISFTMGTAVTAQNTQRNLPAPLAILSCLYEGTMLPMDKALQVESKYFGQLLAGPVARNMMRTLFINKNAADKLARRPDGVPPRKVKTVGILGAGLMGAGIAHVSAAAGIEVVLLDSSQSAADKGRAYSQDLLDKAVKRKSCTPEQREALLARITPTIDYALLESCDLVIEAVFEDRAVKADVTARAEAVIGAGAVFASNTSTLPITSLATASQRPDQFIGLHFFSPVDKMPLVEIIVGQQTSAQTLARGFDYVQQIGKTPIVVNDSRGFYTSRVFATYVLEGIAMLAEGVHPRSIEQAGLQAGMPMPPLALQDEVSLSLSLHVAEQTRKDLSAEGKPYVGHPAEPVLRQLCEIGRVGKKVGQGFYDWGPGDKTLWPELARLFPVAAAQPGQDELMDRLMFAQANEAARCFEEGVLRSAADANIGSIFGWGFAPFQGGALQFINAYGVGRFVARAQELAQTHGERFAPAGLLVAMAQRSECFEVGGPGTAA